MNTFFLERYRSIGHSLTGKEKTRQSIRVNTLRTSGAELEMRLALHGAKLSKIPWLRDGFMVEDSKFSLGASFEYLLGLYSLQEAAAQYPVEILAPRPGERVLDMCAAPGGKTTQIAAWMQGKGILIAFDANRERLYALENNLERSGVENCIVYHADAAEMELGEFDRVLLDSPCSGNYVTDADWFEKRSLEDVEFNAARQKKLLAAAVRSLKPGGSLVYTTCSLEPEENEMNIHWLLANHSIRLVEVTGPGSPGLTEYKGEKLNPDVAKTRRFWPDETGTQGFYLAKAVKK